MHGREEGLGRREATVKAREAWTAKREVQCSFFDLTARSDASLLIFECCRRNFAPSNGRWSTRGFTRREWRLVAPSSYQTSLVEEHQRRPCSMVASRQAGKMLRLSFSWAVSSSPAFDTRTHCGLQERRWHRGRCGCRWECGAQQKRETEQESGTASLQIYSQHRRTGRR